MMGRSLKRAMWSCQVATGPERMCAGVPGVLGCTPVCSCVRVPGEGDATQRMRTGRAGVAQLTVLYSAELGNSAYADISHR